MSDTSKIWAKLSKGFGGDSFLRATDPLKLNWDIINMPSYTLGDAVGSWGIPLGGITQLHGLEGCGKTFYSMLMVKQAQEQFPGSECVWIDAETSFNKKWAEKIGIDLNRLMILPTNDGVDMFRQLCGKVTKGKKVQEGILDYVISGDLNVKLVVLDSIAQIIPPAEQGRDFDEMEMAGLARFLPRAFRRLRPQLQQSKVAMLAINQAKMSLDYGGGLTYSGGKGLRYNLDLAIKLHASTAKDSTLFDEKGKKCGHKIIATVEKCRAGSNMYQAEFWLDFTKGIVNKGEEVALLGAAYDVVSRPNNLKWEYKDQSIVGKDNFFKHLEDNPDLMNEIIEEVKRVKDSGAERSAHLSDEGREHAGETDSSEE